MTQSMSRVVKCIDNRPLEGFFGILKSEMFYDKKFKSLEVLKEKITEYTIFYNEKDFKKNRMLGSDRISKPRIQMCITI